MSIQSQYRALLEERLKPKAIDVPGFERGSIAIRLLTDKQISEAKIAAYQYLERVCKEAGVSVAGLVDVDAEVYDRERVIQLMWRAFVSATEMDDDDIDPKSAFDHVAWVRDLDAVTVQELFDTYLAFQDTKSLQAPDVAPEMLDEFVDALNDEGGEILLSRMGASQLRALVILLAKRGE